MESFYKRLSYSIGNEDWKSETQALNIQPNDRVLCVTASGDRPLNLLCKPCKEMIALDINPYQSALLDLKQAALSCFDYDEYLAFLGWSPHPNRKEAIEKMQNLMQPIHYHLWKKSSKMAKGILYQGALERWTQFLSLMLKQFRGKKVDKLFSCDSSEEQKKYVEKEWDSYLWKQMVNAILGLSTLFFNDPVLYKHVDTTIQPRHYLKNRIHYAMQNFPIKESILLSLGMQGKIFKEGFSAYLSEAGTQQIRSHLNTLSIQTEDIIGFLEKTPDNSIDCFSLSDVISYLNKKKVGPFFQEVYRTSKPGARFCVRQFFSRREIPDNLKGFFVRDLGLERQLHDQDRCFLYQFTVGTIKKDYN